jgi:hypothetical protein
VRLDPLAPRATRVMPVQPEPKAMLGWLEKLAPQDRRASRERLAQTVPQAQKVRSVPLALREPKATLGRRASRA